MCLRKGKYHTDLHWAESCVLLLGGHEQPERLCGGKCIPGTPRKGQSWCSVSPTEHPAHHNLHKHHSLLQTLSRGPREGCYKKWETLMGIVPRSTGYEVCLRIPIYSNKNRSEGTRLSYKFKGHPALCVAPLCLRWFMWFPPSQLSVPALPEHPITPNVPAFNPTLESCGTTTFPGVAGTMQGCAQDTVAEEGD